MSNKQINELSLRLSQALDQNYDVVSLESVLSVLTTLEGATITKEQLEATRLAKYINQLRRRTKSDNLARRAKSLLKKWREMVGIQQGSDSTPVGATGSATSNSLFSPSAPNNIPDTENTVSTYQLTIQQNQCPLAESNTKQLHQPCQSQPTSPLSYIDNTNANECINSTISNPALVSLLTQSSNLTQLNKKRIEKISDQKPLQQQPTSFANLITGLGSFNSLSLQKSRSECSLSYTTNPTETFIIDNSSNSNSDKAVSTYTSAKNVPQIVIDLQDTNSSMNSFVSKDVTKYSLTEPLMQKYKKEKKRKERDVTLQNQHLHNCDENNTTSTTSNHHQRPLDMLTVEEKPHYTCPTISNISEILSLSNSSLSSVFPFTDANSKNIYDSCHNGLASSKKMSKSDLTFAGKFKQSTSSISTMCEVLTYKSDNVKGYSPNKNKFMPFAGIGVVRNSRDSTSNSHILQLSVPDDAVKDANGSIQKVEELQLKNKCHDKSMSNISNKGYSSANIVFDIATPNIIYQQQNQSIDLNLINSLSEQPIKQPKKRGRKKGSKGVDSVIAKETSLSSHMLISSFSTGVKKVKTTKELYAEMQNRKLYNVTMPLSGVNTIRSPAMNWPLKQQQKKLVYKQGSSCSDIAESDSCTMTSEQSCDSANPLKIVKRETMLDSNSNYSQFDSEHKVNDVVLEDRTAPITATATTSTIQNQMFTILKQLAPPPSVNDIEQESLTNIMQCTCTIVEIIPKAEKDAHTSKHLSTDMLLCATNKKVNIVKENKPIEVENTNTSIITNFTNKQEDHFQQTSTKFQKSIFDLDFEEEEDPLNVIIADILAKTSNSNNMERNLIVGDGISAVKFKTEDDAKKDDQLLLVQSAVVSSLPILDNIDSPTYEVKFDPDCIAKTRFEVQTQQITKFHIDSLHNCLVPNVNGNWNHADVTSDINIIRNNDDNLDSKHIIDGYRVVPCYGSEINENIVKDLSHVKFTKKFKHSTTFTKNNILNKIPFMGVARLIGVTMKSRTPELWRRKEGNTLMREENLFLKCKDEYSKQSESHQSLLDLCSTPVKTYNNSGVLNTLLIDKIINNKPESTSVQNYNFDVNCTNLEGSVTDDVKPVKQNDVSEFCENSIKMVNEKTETTDNIHFNSRRNSNSSINSLKQYQHSINLKLEHPRHKNKNLDQSKKTRSNLKRTNTAFKKENTHFIKRLNIAINGNKETQKLIHSKSCSHTTNENSLSGDDRHYEVIEDNEIHKSQFDEALDDYNAGYHHEVVSHGISDTSSGGKHIVLTIKKTQSKSNSAVTFVSAVSPALNRSSYVNSLENNVDIMNFKLIKSNQKRHMNQTDNQFQNRRKEKEEEYRRSYKNIFCEKPIKMSRLNFFKKRLKRKNVSFLSYSSRSNKKLHKLLFFSNEICHFIKQGTQRSKDYIFNISSCSSSCSDEADNDNGDSENDLNLAHEKNYKEHNEYSNIVRSPSLSSLTSLCSERLPLKLQTVCNINYEMKANAIKTVTYLENSDVDDNDDELPLENNRMLITFNNLCCNTRMGVKKITNNHGHEQRREPRIYYEENMLKQPHSQNFDDNLYNSQFKSLIKYIDKSNSFVNNDINSSNKFEKIHTNSSSSHSNCIINKRKNNDFQISTNNEYNTIKRSVDTNAIDSNSVRLEQFKEWHEVLQLRSYNDELLTVLPYVVLE